MAGTGLDFPAGSLADLGLASSLPSSNRQTSALGSFAPIDRFDSVVSDGGVSNKAPFEATRFGTGIIEAIILRDMILIQARLAPVIENA
jgi:hypothetical protein